MCHCCLQKPVASEVEGERHKPSSRPAVTQAFFGPLNGIRGAPHVVQGLTLLVAVKTDK